MRAKIAAIAIAALFVPVAASARTQTPPQPQSPTPQTSPQTPQPTTPQPTTPQPSTPRPATPQTTTPPNTPQVTPPTTTQTPQTTTPTSPNPQTTSSTSQSKASENGATQTFTGCLMSEPDYRRAHNLGAGALGGVGLGDEYVLVDVKVSPESGAMGSSSPAMSSTDKSSNGSSSMSASNSTRSNTNRASSSNSACADRGTAYRLTGSQEEKLKGLVGHQLEVQGRFKHADDVAAAGTAAGDKLPAEVEIVSYREARGAAAVTEPMPPTDQTPRSQSTRTPAVSTPSTTTAPTTTPSTTTTRELPHSASATPLLALIGVLALSSGLVLTLKRRRAL